MDTTVEEFGGRDWITSAVEHLGVDINLGVRLSCDQITDGDCSANRPHARFAGNAVAHRGRGIIDRSEVALRIYQRVAQ
jgi:hypothetical protein